MKILIRPWVPFLALALTLGLTWTAAAETRWEAVPAPETNGGLVLAPRLESGAGRLQMAWGWTNPSSKILDPEFTYSSFNGSAWTRPKAPYFGDNLGRLRKLDMARARQAVGVIYQRTLDQDDRAFEVLYAVSGDGGWSYSRPAVADSYVHEESVGTAVAMAGIGGRRPTFALGWLTEGRAVRVGVLDPNNNSDRPRASTLGTHGSRSERLELAGDDEGGFIAVWSDGRKLESCRLRPIVGTPEASETVFSGSVGRNFVLTDWQGKRPTLVFEADRAPTGGGPRRQVMRWADRRWQSVDLAAPPQGEAEAPSTLEAVQDEDGEIHVLALPRAGDQVLYSRTLKGRWTEPESVFSLNPRLGVTGFDLAVLKDNVFAVVAQGPHLQVARRTLKP